MALTMSDEQERARRKRLASPHVLMNGECFCSNCGAIAFAAELDATRACVTELERERDRALASAVSAALDHEKRCNAEDALAATQAERDALAAALYPLVIGCLMADANEDAPEFVNGEAERGRDALPKCGRCGGCGALDGVEYVDVVIPEAVRCPDCEGWGFLARPVGSVEVLRERLVLAWEAGYLRGCGGCNPTDGPPWDEDDCRNRDAAIARLLEPRGDTPEADKKGAEG